MKTWIQSTFIIVCLAFLLTACHKNEVEIVVNSGTYSALGQEVNGVRLFTGSGEIKNAATTNSFVRRRGENRYFVTNANATLYGITGTSIEFLSPDEAVFNYMTNIYPVNVITKNNVLYLESKVITELNEYVYDEVTIYKKMLTYTPLYSDTLSTDAELHTIRTKNCFYMTQKGSIIKFPRLSYVYVQPYSIQAGMFINNTFNDSCISLLNVADTLAIQQTEILFLKK